jgi:hypothetical protein
MLTVKAVDDPGQLCQCFELGRDYRHGGTYDQSKTVLQNRERRSINMLLTDYGLIKRHNKAL